MSVKSIKLLSQLLNMKELSKNQSEKLVIANGDTVRHKMQQLMKRKATIKLP